MQEFPWPVKEFTPFLKVCGSDGVFDAQEALDQCCHYMCVSDSYHSVDAINTCLCTQQRRKKYSPLLFMISTFTVSVIHD